MNDVTRVRLVDNGLLPLIVSALQRTGGRGPLGGARGARDALGALLNVALDEELVRRLKAEEGTAPSQLLALAESVRLFAQSADEKAADCARGVLLQLGQLSGAENESPTTATGGAQLDGGGGRAAAAQAAAAETRFNVFLSHKARWEEARVGAAAAAWSAPSLRNAKPSHIISLSLCVSPSCFTSRASRSAPTPRTSRAGCTTCCC